MEWGGPFNVSVACLVILVAPGTKLVSISTLWRFNFARSSNLITCWWVEKESRAREVASPIPGPNFLSWIGGEVLIVSGRIRMVFVSFCSEVFNSYWSHSEYRWFRPDPLRWLRFGYMPDATASLMIGAYKGNARWIGAMKDWLLWISGTWSPDNGQRGLNFSDSMCSPPSMNFSASVETTGWNDGFWLLREGSFKLVVAINSIPDCASLEPNLYLGWRPILVPTCSYYDSYSIP